MKKLYEDTNIKAIADAIRAKNGTANTYKVSEMADAITEIQAGGGAADAIIDRSITEVSSSATSVGTSAFYDCLDLETADFPLATKIESNAFVGCEKLTEINFPIVTYIGASAFNGCSSLRTAVFPEVTSTGTNAFINCNLLETIDFHKITNIGGFSFRYGHKLTAVILRSATVCSIFATTVFSGCDHILGTSSAVHNPTGAKDGYIYVPSSLVDSYKADEVWSEFSTQIRALEDYTVDGTTTGALDESKI